MAGAEGMGGGADMGLSKQGRRGSITIVVAGVVVTQQPPTPPHTRQDRQAPPYPCHHASLPPFSLEPRCPCQSKRAAPSLSALASCPPAPF